MNVGMLGSGGMARGHARHLLNRRDVRLVAVCARSEERGSSWRSESGASDATLYTDFDTMLDNEQLDALYVCLAPDAHTGQVERAAARGIHLFLEKPIALGVDRAQSMVDAIEAAGVVSQVGYHLRFRKTAQRLDELIGAGLAGRPTLFEGRFWCNMAGSDWWRSSLRSGGQTYEQAIHIYDLALHFMGLPERVWGQLDRLCHQQADYAIEDTSLGMIRFADGAMASISASNCAVPDRYIGDWRAVFERVTVEYRSTGDGSVPPEATLRFDGQTEHIVEDGDVFAAETAAFVAAVRAGRPSPVPARDGLRGIQLVTAVLSSANRGGSAVTFADS